MRRKFSKFDLGGGAAADDAEDPMAGVTNLADCMLVLAVGILLALVVNWNIDISPAGAENTTVPRETVSEIGGFVEGGDSEIDAETQYEKMDVEVYRDPATGKLYMVEK
jgi:hypothetical protein